jgi:hypothetical protein
MLRQFSLIPVFLLFASFAHGQCTVSFTSAAVAEPTLNTIDAPGVGATSPLSFTQNPQGADCGSWTVSADSAWIGFPAGTSGASAQIPYTVNPNTGGPRTAIITVTWPNAGGGPQSAPYTVNQLGVVPASGSLLAVQYRLDLAYGSAGCSPSDPLPFTCSSGSGPYVLNLPPATYSVQATFHIANTANSGLAPLDPMLFVGTPTTTVQFPESIASGTNIQVDVPPNTSLYLYLLNTVGSTIPDPNNYVDVVVSATGLSCTSLFGPTLVGTAYTTTCTAAGGTPPWTVSTNFAAPVDGITPTVTGQDATIAGTPTNAAVGDYSFYVSATDSTPPPAAPLTSVAPFSGTLPPPGAGLQIGCTPNYGPTNPGFQYSAVCTATGGTGQYSWSIVGALPTGLLLTQNGNSATISGSPTDPTFGTQNVSYIVQVQDATNAVAQYTFSTQFSGTGEGSNILIGCSPGNGPVEVGVPFTQRCSAFNSVSPYSWRLGASSSLPLNLTLTKISDTDAIVSGVLDPSTVGFGFLYVLQVIDSDDDSPNEFTVAGSIVVAQVTVTCANAGGNLILGTAYSNTCTGAGGVPAANAPLYTYWISAGALPAGLALSPTTGAISGAPTTAGAYSFTVQVYDSVHGVAVTGFTVSGAVAAPLAITCGSANGPQEVGVAYSNTCNVTGGFPPYDIFLGQSLSPPAGVTFSTAPPTLPTSAIVAGTPTAAGVGAYRYIIQVFDSAQASVNQTFAGNVAAALGVSCSNTAAPTQAGVQYTTICTANNGVSPFTWTTTGLPAGLTTSAATGQTFTINGAPVQGGTVSYSAKVTDAATASAQQTWQGNVLPPVPTLTSSNPAAGVATSTATLTLTGTGFVTGTVVNFNGTPLTPRSIAPTALAVAVPANLIALAGAYPITVTTSGGTSGTVLFPVAPLLSAVTPNSAIAGSPALPISVNGAGFVQESVTTVNWNGAALATAFVSPTQLTATIPAADLAATTTANLTVTSAGQVSAPQSFVVSSTPMITSLSPASAADGSPGFTLAVNGSGFSSNAVVQWNGTALTTTPVSASQLTAAVPASLLTAPDVASVTVLSGGVTTAPTSFTISATPAITGLSTTIAPSSTATVGVSVANPASVDLNGSLQLSFVPSIGGLPPNYIDPFLQFSCTGATCNDIHTALDFTIPAGQTSVSPVPGGTITSGTVAGTITVMIASLKRADTQANVVPATPVTTNVEVPKMMPVTASGSVKITNLTSTGFNVEFDGYSNTRELSSITVTFMPAPGTRLNGTTSFTIPVSSAFATWFNSTEAQTQQGGNFGVSIPFTLSGDSKAINSVTVTLTNSIGPSIAESGTVQ